MHKLIWRNLRAHPLRSALTVLAIALGVGMVLAAAIVGQAAGQSASELVDQVSQVDLDAIIVQGGLAMLALFVIVLTPGGTASMGFRVDWDLALMALPPALRDLGQAAALSLVLGPLVAALAAAYPAGRATGRGTTIGH